MFPISSQGVQMKRSKFKGAPLEMTSSLFPRVDDSARFLCPSSQGDLRGREQSIILNEVNAFQEVHDSHKFTPKYVYHSGDSPLSHPCSRQLAPS